MGSSQPGSRQTVLLTRFVDQVFDEVFDQERDLDSLSVHLRVVFVCLSVCLWSFRL